LLHDRPVGLAGDKLNTVTTHNPQCMRSPHCTPNIFNFHWQVYGLLYSTAVSAMTNEYPQLSVCVWLLKALCSQKCSHLWQILQICNASLVCINAHETEVQASNCLGPNWHSVSSTSLAITPLSIHVPPALHEPGQPHQWHRSEEGSSSSLTSTMEEKVIQTCHEFAHEIL
jgi:hypothetical protein